jgi:ABC-type transport system involved in cytochrome c biogenesis permease subunit
MKTDENKPKSAYSTRIKICLSIFFLLYLMILCPTTVPWQGEREEWMITLLPIPGIILLPTVISRGKIVEKIVALILLVPFVWLVTLGIRALLARYENGGL